MSCVNVGEVWKNEIGEGTEVRVSEVLPSGWVKGVCLKKLEGKKELQPGTGFLIHHDLMVLTMKKVS